MNRYIYTAVLIMVASSCTFDKMQLQRPEELGTDKDEYIIEAEGGSAQVRIYANMEGKAYFAVQNDWAEMDAAHFVADRTITVTVHENTGRPRMATMVLNTSARKDTVLIKQKGVKDEFLKVSATAASAGSNESEILVPIDTNIDSEHIIFNTEYSGNDEAWLGDISIRDGAVAIRCLANTSESVRRAVVSVSYDNGWGELITNNVRITQAGAGDSDMNISLAQLKAKAGQYPAEITEPFIIEGHIVSDKESGNVGENIQTTTTTVNYTGCLRTAYLQAKDGESGILLEFETEDDNIVTFNSAVSICLEGATLAKYSNPERYSVTGLNSSSVLSCSKADESEIKVKTCRMSELTDNDLYTRVTLTDCEFPVRKGSLTPVHEGYTSTFGWHRFTKFPTMIRDIEGEHMYMYTNTTCPYRRNGSGIGYGSGKVTGVLVHEKYKRFIDGESTDEDECGYIGKYQIRHMSFEDLDFSGDSFSGLVCEWRYIDSINEDGSWNATAGNGTMTHSTTPSSRFLSNGMTGSVQDYSYLGPILGSSPHANENGFGIEDVDSDAGIKKYGIEKGAFSTESANAAKLTMAWRNNNWYAGNKFQYWLISFSTEDIQTNVLSMQMSVLNTTGGNCPNEWSVEWAESPDAQTWEHVADFNVPDIVRSAITEAWQSPGYRPIDIRLPAEMLGKETVCIRLIPRSRKGSLVKYLDSTFSNGSYSSMNYFAIRYNKQ